MISALLCLSIPFVLVHAEPFTASPTGLTDADFERGRSVVPSSNVDTSLTEGDIEFPQGMSEIKGSDRQRNAIKFKGNRWDHGRVPYVLDAAFTKAERANIAWAMNEVMRQTCVTYVPKTDADTDYVEVADRGRCSSLPGKNGGMQQIKLGGCKDIPGSILHEMMHALGFYHEHERNDRDDWVEIRFRNIKSGSESQFEKQLLDHIDHLGTEYDYGSILHYSEYAFSRNGQKTVITLRPKAPGVEIGQRDHLSENDVRKINILYNCSNVPQPATTTKKPVIEVTTKAPVVPESECVDHDEQCSTSFKDYCTSEEGYLRTAARTACPKTCHVEELCGPLVKPTEAPIVPESRCLDLDERCSTSFKDYCTSEEGYLRTAARTACPKTCHVEELCGPLVKPTEAPIEPESKCVDHNEDCSTFYEDYCNSENEILRKMARNLCPKSCHVDEMCSSPPEAIS